MSQGGAQIGRDNHFVPILQEKEVNEVACIKNVYFENLETELPLITELLDKYPYIAMVSSLRFDDDNIVGHRISRSYILRLS